MSKATILNFYRNSIAMVILCYGMAAFLVAVSLKIIALGNFEGIIGWTFATLTWAFWGLGLYCHSCVRYWRTRLNNIA